MTTATLTVLRNRFHGTCYRTRKTREELDAIENTAPWNRTPAERAFVRRIAGALCGIEGCTCATNGFGER